MNMGHIIPSVLLVEVRTEFGLMSLKALVKQRKFLHQQIILKSKGLKSAFKLNIKYNVFINNLCTGAKLSLVFCVIFTM